MPCLNFLNDKDGNGVFKLRLLSVILKMANLQKTHDKNLSLNYALIQKIKNLSLCNE